jgi:glycosyltransferase involved in cell wall biosynthesis
MAYSQAKVLVVPSARLIREAEGFGFPPDSIIHVPNPVDTSAFRPATTAERRELRAALGIPQDAEVVTYSGRLVAGKGLLTLARAWKDLVPMHPRALLVIIGPGAGQDSPLDAEQALRQYVTTEGMQDRVILTGARNDVERYLAASDVFAFPSVAEGFGNSLVEAMACGLPVICSRGAGGASDLIQEGEQGLKFDAENPASLCAGLHQLLSDEAGCKRMGAASRRLVEERSGLEAAVDSYERAIRRAIERN